MILTGDVASSGRQIQCWNVVRTIAVFEFECTRACSQCEQLMPQTDTHNRDLGRLHQLLQVVDRLLAMGRVTGPIGNKKSIKVMGDLVNGVIERKCCDTCTSIDETAEDVLFDTTVDDSDVCGWVGCADMERGFGANFADKVDLFWVDKSLILISVIFLSDGDPRKR